MELKIYQKGIRKFCQNLHIVDAASPFNWWITGGPSMYEKINGEDPGKGNED